MDATRFNVKNVGMHPKAEHIRFSTTIDKTRVVHFACGSSDPAIRIADLELKHLLYSNYHHIEERIHSKNRTNRCEIKANSIRILK